AVETENANSSVTENEANQTAEKNQVDVHVAPSQEVVQDESEQLEEMQKSIKSMYMLCLVKKSLLMNPKKWKNFNSHSLKK
uniref:hypothetical protein n=1 Tax=Lactococcus petauri TaxID=1940789 RepID=UPI0022DFB4B4